MDLRAAFEIIVGTYEEFLLGYKYFPKSEETKQSFATHSHSSSIRCVCTSGNYLASGGTDDRIFIYDLKLRKEHSVLTHHNGTINCLAFTPHQTHIVCGSADGVLSIVRVGNWQVEKLWESAHKGPILDIAVHTSGKLALTLGTDHSLCTWNLVKGRQAYIINLNSKSKDPKSLQHVLWAPCGVKFLLFGGNFTEIWSIEKGGMLNAIEYSSKVTCCTWMSNKQLLVGFENGKLAIVNTETEKIKLYSGHDNRVKAVAIKNEYIVTASSGGDFKIWDDKLKNCIECNTGCRITCLAVCTEQNPKREVFKEEIVSESEEVTSETNEASESDEIIVVPKKMKKRNVSR